MEVDSLWAVETASVSFLIFTMVLEEDGGEDESSSSSVSTHAPCLAFISNLGKFSPEASPFLLKLLNLCRSLTEINPL
jgi:hypothetical protein